jgi:hypothetical protein
VSPGTRVLAFGKSRGTVERGLALLRDAGFEAEGVTMADEAIALLAAAPFALVVIGGGVGKAERAAVKDAARSLPSPPRIVEVRGTGNLLPKMKAALSE